MTKRNNFLNILQGSLIISVVFGHALQYGNGNLFLQSEVYWKHPLMRLIYSVHMPLFMGIAGYLSFLVYKNVQLLRILFDGGANYSRRF